MIIWTHWLFIQCETLHRELKNKLCLFQILPAQRQVTDVESQGQGESTDAKITTTLKGSMGDRVTKALARVEDKKKRRAARQAQVT